MGCRLGLFTTFSVWQTCPGKPRFRVGLRMLDSRHTTGDTGSGGVENNAV